MRFNPVLIKIGKKWGLEEYDHQFIFYHYGKITIKALLQNPFIFVSITDTGIGVPAQERKDIFKPFHKVDKSRDPSIKGNGTGLSIVKQIVDLHHGEIKVFQKDLREGQNSS